MVSKFLIATALLIATCGCIPQADDPDLVGTWMIATPGEYSGSLVEFTLDDHFTFAVTQAVGTYEVDGSTLTLSFPENTYFCDGGTLLWDYHITDRILTADDVGGTCHGRRHWVLEQIAG